MRASLLGVAAGTCVLASAALSLAVETLTLPQLHQHVRARAPLVLAAQTSLGEARGARAGATPLFAQNPSITGGAGFTAQPSGWQPRSWDSGGAALLAVAVPVELGAQRWTRMAAADGHIRVEELRVKAALLGALHQASEDFLRALHAQLSAEAARDALELAARFREAAVQMQAAGLGSALDVELARLEEADVAGAAAVQHALAARARGELTSRLGLTGGALRLSGALRHAAALPSLKEALAHVAQRPDLQGLDADRDAALRDANVAVAEAFPSPTLGASYQYQYQFPAPQHVVLGQVSFPLPVFARNQGDESRARARARGAAAERDAAVAAARAQVKAAYALVEDVRSNRAQLEASNAGSVDLHARLEAAYRAGRTDLATVLNLQRRVMAVRRTTLDLDLQEALARVWLDAPMGVMP
jgi:outer membrane protein TolC